VLAYNLPGVESLKLSREAYSGIFLGKITKWNDPAIAKTNGQKFANELGYIRLPKAVVGKSVAALGSIE
jgi:ABC-type phosphate transport system substrate-binding protein